MNQSLDVYWTKIGTFWPWCPRESFIILGSQIVPDNNHVVPCHVIICSSQSRRYCVKLEKVDNIGSTNLIITRGSRLKQKENKWWAVFSVFWASASILGVFVWGLWLGLLFRVSASSLCFGSLLWVSASSFSFGSLLWVFFFRPTSPLLVLPSLGLFWGSYVGVSPLGVCFWSKHWFANIGLCFGSLL